MDPFERCNLWLLYTALAWGVDQVRFICLWNGSGGDGTVYAQRQRGELLLDVLNLLAHLLDQHLEFDGGAGGVAVGRL